MPRDDAGYNKLLSERNRLTLSYDTRFNKYTYPQLYNDTVPSEMYSITYNNSWDMCFGYMMSCLKCDDLEEWYEIASTDPKKATQIGLNNITRKNAKESVRTLSDCFHHPNYYACT